MDVRVGPWRRLSAKELMPSNCGAGKDSWKSPDSKEIKPLNPKGNQSWIFIGRTDAEALILLLGEAHWLKPPTLARHHSNHLHELFYDKEVLVRNTELISHHQLKEFGKGQKETPRVHPPPRILFASIYLGWVMRVPPGRTLSQNDWPKTTRKLIPST